MSAQVFADEELERHREFPEVSREHLVRFFTLTPADPAFVDPGRGLDDDAALLAHSIAALDDVEEAGAAG